MSSEPQSTSSIVQVVAAAVLDLDRSTCFAAQRGSAMSWPGRWEFPGGKVESGERPEEALAREIWEEFEMQISVGQRIAGNTVSKTSRGPAGDDTRTLVLDLYQATWIAGEPRALEHMACSWFDAAALRELDWLEADLPMVEEVCRRLSG